MTGVGGEGEAATAAAAECGLPSGTGDDEVDAAVQRLRELDPQDAAADHLAVLTDVHEALQRRLSAAAE